MFLVNGMRAKLRQFNRNENNEVFDDQNYKEITIKCCPYDCESTIKFGIYTVPEATGYYQVPRQVDVKAGDQIIYLGKYSDGKVHTILKVQDSWLYNRVENKIIVVK